MAMQGYSRAPNSRSTIDEESVSRILLEANDVEAQRAVSSCRWMLGCHGVALLIVTVLASVDIFCGSSDGVSKGRPSSSKNFTAVNLNVNVQKTVVDDGGDDTDKFGMDACAWGGEEDCTRNKCCNVEGHQCYVQDDSFAGCREEAPSGWDGTMIGGFRGWEAQKAEPGQCMGSSLWCITVVTTPEENELLEALKKHKVGIYECDTYTVFDGAAAPKDSADSIANVHIFTDIWQDKIVPSQEWQTHDWTVKVDVDLVFFPGRLKQHIDKLCAPKGTGLYLKNTDFQNGFLGSLEIFSQEAIRMYADSGAKCLNHVDHATTEDRYIKACMDAIGAGSMVDATLLDDQYTRGGLSGLSSGVCQSGDTVGFHPFKTEWVWESCHDAASRVSDGPNFKCLSLSCDSLVNTN